MVANESHSCNSQIDDFRKEINGGHPIESLIVLFSSCFQTLENGIFITSKRATFAK
jgi:hypothetical protein